MDDSSRDDEHNSQDFWKILGIDDEFDKAYIITQIEKFCALYSIRSAFDEDEFFDSPTGILDPTRLSDGSVVGLPVDIPNHGLDVSAYYPWLP